MKKKDIIFIPVRKGSTRLKNKLNLSLAGNKILSHTINRAILSNCFDKIIIATSNIREFKNYKSKFVEVIKTPDASTGTERVSKIIKKYNAKNIYILFGDEFLIMPDQIKKFVKLTKNVKNFSVFNAVSNISVEDIDNNSIVKCIIKKQKIIDFKRVVSLTEKKNCKNSVGLFCIKKDLLVKFQYLKSKKSLDKKIEQFKFLDNKFYIKSVILDHPYPSLNTKKDFEDSKKLFEKNKKQRNILNKY